MITIEEANELVLQDTYITATETVGLNELTGRVLAIDIRSDTDVPSFDKSAMDGYACVFADIKKELEVIETIPAGKKPQKTVINGQCSKIMTGAMMPAGADCVIMVEYTEVTSDNRIKFLNETTNRNIRYKGEDIKQGEIVLRKGILIKPQHIAILASVGCVETNVYKKPKVAVISTGDELVEPIQKPELSQIRNSNAYQLIAQVKNAGAIPYYNGIVKDTMQDTFEAISNCLRDNDIVLLTGGVSEGDFDFVPEAFAHAGIEMIFDSIAIQPGRPTIFGRIDNKYCFGLPGNPVSSFVQFEMLVKPLIYKMMGSDSKNIIVKLPINKHFKRKKITRKSVLPVIITNDGKVSMIDYNGSAHIQAYCQADAMMIIEEGVAEIKQGELVDVRLI